MSTAHCRLYYILAKLDYWVCSVTISQDRNGLCCWLQHIASTYGHPDDDILWKLPEMVKEAPKLITIPTAKKPCKACAKGKMPSRSFLPSVSWATKPFQRVHPDLKDMIKRSFNGYHYILTVLDDFMSHTWSFNLKKKSDTIIHAWQFVLWNSLLSYLISSYQHFSLVVLWNSPSAPYLISLILSTMPLSSY